MSRRRGALPGGPTRARLAGAAGARDRGPGHTSATARSVPGSRLRLGLAVAALLARLADGFSAAPRGPAAAAAPHASGHGAARAACAACASVRAPGLASAPAPSAALSPRARLRRPHGVVAAGADEAAAETGQGDGDGAGAPHGGHGYVSILRSAVQRGCNVSLMGRVYGNYKKRKLNIEHIVPRAVILAAAGSPGGPPPPANADACDDLYNMFLAVPNINRARRDYKFCAEPFGSDAKRRPTVIYGQLNSKKRKFSEKARDVWWSLGNGLFVNDRVARFVPREQDRGLIGRAVLHMADTWGCDADAVVEGGRSAAEQWHREYPADEAELAHIRHVAPLMSYPHSVFHEEKAGGLFSLRPAFTGDVVDK